MFRVYLIEKKNTVLINMIIYYIFQKTELRINPLNTKERAQTGGSPAIFNNNS